MSFTRIARLAHDIAHCSVATLLGRRSTFCVSRRTMRLMRSRRSLARHWCRTIWCVGGVKRQSNRITDLKRTKTDVKVRRLQDVKAANRHFIVPGNRSRMRSRYFGSLLALEIALESVLNYGLILDFIRIIMRKPSRETSSIRSQPAGIWLATCCHINPAGSVLLLPDAFSFKRRRHCWRVDQQSSFHASVPTMVVNHCRGSDVHSLAACISPTIGMQTG